MPKRLVDGEALWRSDKLNKVVPAKFRAEYANLIPLAEADGTFEADPRRVWANVYSYNRPDVTVAQVSEMLSAFEEAGMLVRKVDENGKVWGMFVGIEERLPAKSQRGRYKQGKASVFNQMSDIQSNSRPNPDEVHAGLVRFGLGKDRLGLEPIKSRLADSVSPEIQAASYAADDEKIEKEIQEHLAAKKAEAELAELSRGQI